MASEALTQNKRAEQLNVEIRWMILPRLQRWNRCSRWCIWEVAPAGLGGHAAGCECSIPADALLQDFEASADFRRRSYLVNTEGTIVRDGRRCTTYHVLEIRRRQTACAESRVEFCVGCGGGASGTRQDLEQIRQR